MATICQLTLPVYLAICAPRALAALLMARLLMLVCFLSSVVRAFVRDASQFMLYVVLLGLFVGSSASEQDSLLDCL